MSELTSERMRKEVNFQIMKFFQIKENGGLAEPILKHVVFAMVLMRAIGN